jgi:hypothetical protein
MSATVPLSVGLDYSQHAVQVCILDPAGRVLCNSRCPDSVLIFRPVPRTKTLRAG